MKKCPFCAEEIQDEAIKCRHCNTSLTGGAKPGVGAAPAPVMAPAGRAQAPGPDDEKRMIYEGTPSWRAYFNKYLLSVVFTVAAPVAGYWIANKADATSLNKMLSVAVPIAVGVIAFLVVTLVRKANKVRLSSRSVELEQGIFSKKIDVLELWRIRDVRYKQSFLDRILGIAHIEVFTKDVTSPHFEIVGMPASRQVFEKLRDSIELQRQSKRVMGIMD